MPTQTKQQTIRMLRDALHRFAGLEDCQLVRPASPAEKAAYKNARAVLKRTAP